jgi:hypothetical protein
MYTSVVSKAYYPLHCVQCAIACSYFGGLSLYRANLARDDPALTRSDCLSDPVQAKSCRIILHTHKHRTKIEKTTMLFLLSSESAAPHSTPEAVRHEREISNAGR